MKRGFSNPRVDLESASFAISWDAARYTASFTIRFHCSFVGGLMCRSGIVGRLYRDSIRSMWVTQDADLLVFMIYWRRITSRVVSSVMRDRRNFSAWMCRVCCIGSMPDRM